MGGGGGGVSTQFLRKDSPIDFTNHTYPYHNWIKSAPCFFFALYLKLILIDINSLFSVQKTSNCIIRFNRLQIRNTSTWLAITFNLIINAYYFFSTMHGITRKSWIFYLSIQPSSFHHTSLLQVFNCTLFIFSNSSIAGLIITLFAFEIVPRFLESIAAWALVQIALPFLHHILLNPIKYLESISYPQKAFGSIWNAPCNPPLLLSWLKKAFCAVVICPIPSVTPLTTFLNCLRS